MSKPIVIIGSGGHAKVVCSIALAAKRQVTGFFDELIPDKEPLFGLPVWSDPSDLPSDFEALIAVGDNSARKRLSTQYDFDWATLIHPFSSIAPEVKIGKGTVVCAGAIVQPYVSVGDHVILNTHSSVDHDSKIADYAHICPGANLAGQVTVGELSMIGTGAAVIPGVKIGNQAVIGAGSVVIKDVPDGQTFVGNPAKQAKPH